LLLGCSPAELKSSLDLLLYYTKFKTNNHQLFLAPLPKIKLRKTLWFAAGYIQLFLKFSNGAT